MWWRVALINTDIKASDATTVRAQELSGTTPTANMISGGIDETFQRTDTGGTFSFLSDALGSTLALTNINGAFDTQYTYGPYGSTTAIAGASTNSFQYTGRENDGTGLYYYRARYHSPTFGHFISEDPLGFKAGPNLYAYANSSPTNATDPSGLQAPAMAPAIAVCAIQPEVCLAVAAVVGTAYVYYTSTNSENSSAETNQSSKAKCDNSGKQARCTRTRFNFELRGCEYDCEDGTQYFDPSCNLIVYKNWGE